MSILDDKISDLETKLKQAKAKRQQIEARQRAAESERKRTTDTRKKILVGAAVLNKVETDPGFLPRLTTMLDSFLTRPDDRALFDLPPKPASTPTEPVVKV